MCIACIIYAMPTLCRFLRSGSRHPRFVIQRITPRKHPATYFNKPDVFNMTCTRESDNHDDGRQAKRPRLQTGRGRASNSGRGRGRRVRVPTDPPPAENQGEHTIPIQAQSNDTGNTPALAMPEPISVDLTRYKTWRGKQSSSARVYRVLT